MLEELDLAENSIDKDQAIILSNILRQNDTLKTLSLVWNDIGDEGAIAFANALANNSTLQILDLMDNYSITFVGWQAFLRPLCDTSRINNVCLCNHTLDSLGRIPPEELIVHEEHEKIHKYYFIGKFDVSPLANMNLGHTPHIIAYIIEQIMNRELPGSLIFSKISLHCLIMMTNFNLVKKPFKRNRSCLSEIFSGILSCLSTL